MMVPIALCYCELVPALPVAGGGMAFAFRAFNDKVAVISGWAAFGGFVSIIPWEAIQITDVLGYLIPGLTDGEPLYYVAGTGIHLTTIIIGVICSFLLFALNMRGLAAAAGVQKILCFIQLFSGKPEGCDAVGNPIKRIFIKRDWIITECFPDQISFKAQTDAYLHMIVQQQLDRMADQRPVADIQQTLRFICFRGDAGTHTGCH